MTAKPGNELGRRIRHYRETAGLNQTDVERLTGVRRDYLSSVETGRISVIYPDNFNLLRKVLHFPGWEVLDAMGYETDCADEEIVPVLLHVARQLTAEQQKALADIGRSIARSSS